jgi:hypothetical protein
MKNMGFIDGKLIFMRIRFDLTGIIDPSPKDTYQIYEDTTALLNEFTD